ncbi:MAG: hypothetical protein KatS3mg077_1787 [Candidatus Binatia bacterium]|nr:MAG: hypothetical protein KatS3mg077_1787 [Candidatus Binatia bacterium]
MRLVKRSPWLMGLGVLLAGLVTAPGARADVTSDESGTLLIYPKVVSDGVRDTLIQMSNRTNSFVMVHCFYINASGSCSSTTTQSCEIDADCPTGETCIRQCNSTNFELALTAQQPVQWRVSTGRLTVIPSSPCRPGQPCQCSVDNSGQLVCPGMLVGQNNSSFVPPVGTDFVGELKCYQIDSNGDPTPGNALKGTATIETIATGQISEYNALAVAANADTGNGLNNDRELRLNFNGSGAGELNYCPASLVFTANAEGVTDAFSGATISTELTLVPCSELLEENLPAPVRLRFVGYNEFEQPLSIEAFSFDCFLNRRLADLPVTGGGLFVNGAQELWKIRIAPRPVNVCYSGSNRGGQCTADSECPGALTGPAGTILGCLPASGVLGVAEEFHTLGNVGTAAFNLRHEGSRSGFGDIITLPERNP